MTHHDEMQIRQEQEEWEIESALNRVRLGLGGEDEFVVLAAALGRGQSTVRNHGDTDE